MRVRDWPNETAAACIGDLDGIIDARTVSVGDCTAARHVAGTAGLLLARGVRHTRSSSARISRADSIMRSVLSEATVVRDATVDTP